MKWGISAMPSKISLFNREVILQIGRSTGWLSIIYFLGLLFSLPLRMIMIVSDKNNMPPTKVANLFQYDFPIQMGLIVTIPILMAVFLFRYLHVKQAADLMHSLPLKRGRIYHHYALSGVVFLVVPVVIVASVILFLHSVLDLNPYFETKDIFYWIGITILVNLLLFTAGIFVAMMTGISAVHAVLSYIFLLFPVGMVVLLFFNLKILLYGFPSDYYLNRDLERMSPITYFSVLERRPFHWDDAVLYVILTILLYGLGLFFYKKRKLEAASEAIAFSKLRLVFKFGITFCMMLAGGMYFSDFSYNSLGWTIFGYAIGTIIGYIIAEMVLQKTWRIFIHFKGLAIYSSIIVLLVMAIQALGIYENKVPEQDKIKNVLLTDNPNIFLDQNKMYEHYYIPKSLKERNNIEAVRKLHKQIIADKKINQKGKNDQFRVAFFNV
jgi:ABC-2 type transport system permease protein